MSVQRQLGSEFHSEIKTSWQVNTNNVGRRHDLYGRLMRWQKQVGESPSVPVKKASYIWIVYGMHYRSRESIAAGVWKSRQHHTERKLTIYCHLSLHGVTQEPGTLRSPFKFTRLCDTFCTRFKYFIEHRTSVKASYRFLLFS